MSLAAGSSSAAGSGSASSPSISASTSSHPLTRSSASGSSPRAAASPAENGTSKDQHDDDEDDDDDSPLYFTDPRPPTDDTKGGKQLRIREYGDEDDDDGGEAGLLSGGGTGRKMGGGTRYRDAEAGNALEATVDGHRDGDSSGGAYWRMATEASQTMSTRHLEHVDGGTVKERKRAYWRAAAVNLILIGGWYTFSTLISIYNKWMFSPDRLNFSFPLFVTTCHMGMQFLLASIALKLFDEKLVTRKPNGDRARPSRHDWLTKVVPCAAATALDIGLSNTSLKTITLTFYTMCKSSNLAFVLFFAFLFRLEVIRWSLIGIITLITIGVIMMVAAETKFVLIGAVQVLTASAMGGLRWTLTQMLLDREGMGLSNPIATIFWLAPVMGGCLVLFSAIFEDWHAIFAGEAGWFAGLWATLKTVALITAPGVLAFGMNLSEFALIQRTSVVTLSVAGIFKEVLTIFIASTIFGDELTPINVTGLCITLVGIGLYNYLKYRLITRGPTAFAAASTRSSASEAGTAAGQLGESIRSRASSFAHSLSRPLSLSSPLIRSGGGGGDANGSIAASGGHSLSSAPSRRKMGGGGGGGGYDRLPNEADEDGQRGVLFDRNDEEDDEDEGGLDAVEVDTSRVSAEILGRERERAHGGTA